MKANELMIGDWVFCTYPSINKPVRVAEIKTVGDNELKIVIYDDDIRLVFNETYIEPIPLTPEILERNGFNGKYKLSYQYDKPEEDFAFTYISYWKGRLSIRVSPDIRGKHSTNVMHINCDYVHQLQQALRLCGIEKDIVL